MTETDTWSELFLTGEFAPRGHILDGLTLGTVSQRPQGAPHSIFQELWHTTKWQTFVLQIDRSEAEWSDYQGNNFPESTAPEDETAWRELVREFLEGSAAAAELAGDESALEVRLADGLTVRERLEGLAVHNAYHLGKIVLLRQLLGVWRPPSEDTQM